ncbi:MAG TPA: aminoglycoside phosphotransferase family protein [Trueperaceae bacterium]
MTLPEQLSRNLRDVWGAEGDAWLGRFPKLLAACADRWQLRNLRSFPELSYNFAASAEGPDGTPYALKMGVPGHEIRREIDALRLYDGQGVARLVDADPDMAALLLELLEPGIMLADLPDDEEATRIAGGVMKELWRPVPQDHAFLHVREWFAELPNLRARYGGGTGPFPAALVDTAERLYAELAASSAETVLLHGDLHHYNILASRRAPWLAIDPKGVVGDPAFDVGPLLENPMPHIRHYPDLRGVLARRVEILGEVLQMDRGRILGWALAFSVLSGWWNLESHGAGWEPQIAVAGHLSDILRTT